PTLKQTDNGQGPKPGRRKGSRARSVPHLPRRSRGHASQSGRGLATCGRGSLGERAEKERLNRHGTRKRVARSSSMSEGQLLARTECEGHRLVEIHLLSRGPRRGECGFIQCRSDGSQPLLIFRPLVRIHRKAGGVELRPCRREQRSRARGTPLRQRYPPEPDQLVGGEVPVPSLVCDFQALPKERHGLRHVSFEHLQCAEVPELDGYHLQSSQFPVHPEILPIELSR